VPLSGDGRLLGMVGDTLLVTRHDPSLGRMDGSLPVWRVEAVGPDGSARGSPSPPPTADSWWPPAPIPRTGA
uniref:hypothetical protein n=1 Tax=Streptomyces prasinus TaxID=67345 RepID=UPI00146FDCE4